MVPVVILGRNGSQCVSPRFGRVAVQRVTTGSGEVQLPELTVVGLADVFDGRGHAGTELQEQQCAVRDFSRGKVLGRPFVGTRMVEGGSHGAAHFCDIPRYSLEHPQNFTI